MHATNETTLTLDERTRLRRLIDSDGETNTARAMAVSRHTILRALAGLSVRRGSARLVRLGLQRDRAASSSPEVDRGASTPYNSSKLKRSDGF